MLCMSPHRILTAMLKGVLGMLSLWAVGAVALRAALVPAQVCPAATPAEMQQSARAGAAWIERAQQPDGSYLYEYNAGDDTEGPGYNIVRHAGVTMSLYQVTAAGDLSVLPAADRGLEFMTDNMYRRDGWAAFQDPSDGNVRLGGSALMLAGLGQRRLATGDTTYDPLMREVSRFMLVMQEPDGSFLDTFDQSTGEPLPGRRSKYATGEAFWALTLMHEAFPGEGWDAPARRVADYLTFYRDDYEKQKFPPWPDQWAAYGLSEMADWPLSDANIAYARTLADRFGFLVRVESQRRDSTFSELLHGPRARAGGLGTWVEGLTSLHRLATEDPRMGDMRAKIGERAACGAGMLAARQVTPEDARNYARPQVAEGAWFIEDVTRMDDQQHALSGLLYAGPIVAGRGGRD